jgi:hypothetical protein
MRLYMFRRVRLSIIRSSFTVNPAMLYNIEVCRQLASRSIRSCSKAVYKPVWHIPLLGLQWINSWWWTDDLSETCRISRQNKFVKLVYLVGFIIKKSTHVVFTMSVNWRLLLGPLCGCLSVCPILLTPPGSVKLILLPLPFVFVNLRYLHLT